MHQKATIRRLPIASVDHRLPVPLEGAPVRPASALLRVGDVAKSAGKTVRAIHHYEELGLLSPTGRSKGGYRLYDEGAVTRVRWISKLHELGLSLTQIQEIVSTWESAPSAPRAMAKIRAVYEKKIAETRAQIENLKILEGELSASIAYLDTCDTCDPDELVAACSRCENHDHNEREPELVAGIHA
jgi:MerR family transcriptional regulator, copper efflux regulator